VEKVLNFFEIVLISPDDPQVKVNIVDVGHGMSQVLPIIVRNFINAGASNSIDIIEQPELHLHPGAHANLAELFVNTVKRESSSFVIETHSENFILRIRNLVAKGSISKNDVQIYWVEDDERPGSQLVKIDLDDNGDVSFWPSGVFSESLLEASQLRKAQREQNNVSSTQSTPS
jgi:predicted ATPase